MEIKPKQPTAKGPAETFTGDVWVDYPAHLHHNGSILSFADAHAEYWVYADPRTAKIPDHNFSTPAPHPDLALLWGCRQWLTPHLTVTRFRSPDVISPM